MESNITAELQRLHDIDIDSILEEAAEVVVENANEYTLKTLAVQAMRNILMQNMFGFSVVKPSSLPDLISELEHYGVKVSLEDGKWRVSGADKFK